MPLVCLGLQMTVLLSQKLLQGVFSNIAAKSYQLSVSDPTHDQPTYDSEVKYPHSNLKVIFMILSKYPWIKRTSLKSVEPIHHC